MRRHTPAMVAREAIHTLSRSGLEPPELMYEVGKRVQHVMPCDVSDMKILDPDALLPMAAVGAGAPDGLPFELLRQELHEPDVNKFRDLAVSRRPVATLSSVSPRELGDDSRVWTIFKPAGLGDELRVVFRERGAPWGCACFDRAADAPQFDADEAAFIEDVAADIAFGLRRGLVRPPQEPAEDQSETGLALFDEELELISANAVARRLQRLLPLGGETAIRVAAMLSRSGVSEPGAPTLRMRMTSGRWLLVHASELHGTPGMPRRTAITLEPANGTLLSPLLCRLHGLSTRESEVADLMLRGRTLEAIADELTISGHTLRDHCKAIFLRVGVRTRPQLMAVLAGDVPA